MITSFATSVGIDKIVFTWNSAYIMTVFCFCLVFGWFIGTRLHYMAKRQPLYELINEPWLIKETFRDCLKGKMLPDSNKDFPKVLALLSMLYGIIILALLAIKWIAISHGMTSNEVNTMLLQELLKNL